MILDKLRKTAVRKCTSGQIVLPIFESYSLFYKIMTGMTFSYMEDIKTFR